MATIIRMQSQLRKKLFSAGILTACIICFTLLQGYWALWPYSDGISSSCMECSFLGDLFSASALPLVATGLLHLIYWRLKPRLILKTIFCVVTLMLCWYAIDTTIFDEREASWSTYDSIWYVGILVCILQTSIFGLLFGVVYYFLGRRLN